MEVKEQSEICECRRSEAVKALRAYKHAKTEYRAAWVQYMSQCKVKAGPRPHKLSATLF